MGAALVTVVVLTLTVLAFIKGTALLHAVCMAAWFVVGYVLYNLTYSGNTYIPTAAMLLSLGMVIVHMALTITIVIGRRTKSMTYDDEKDELRKKIFKMKRKEKEDW
jgi:uncharacterized membrane protein